jgi:hypothetical protein
MYLSNIVRHFAARADNSATKPLIVDLPLAIQLPYYRECKAVNSSAIVV